MTAWAAWLGREGGSPCPQQRRIAAFSANLPCTVRVVGMTSVGAPRRVPTVSGVSAIKRCVGMGVGRGPASPPSLIWL